MNMREKRMRGLLAQDEDLKSLLFAGQTWFDAHAGKASCLPYLCTMLRRPTAADTVGPIEWQQVAIDTPFDSPTEQVAAMHDFAQQFYLQSITPLAVCLAVSTFRVQSVSECEHGSIHTSEPAAVVFRSTLDGRHAIAERLIERVDGLITFTSDWSVLSDTPPCPLLKELYVELLRLRGPSCPTT